MVEMSSWRERMAAKAAAAAAAPVKRGVRFIGNATGEPNIVSSPTRKASPHHRNRGVTRRALKVTARVSPANSPPQRPGRGARKFRAAVTRHARAVAKASKKRTTRKKSRKGRKGRKGTRRVHKK